MATQTVEEWLRENLPAAMRDYERLVRAGYAVELPDLSKSFLFRLRPKSTALCERWSNYGRLFSVEGAKKLRFYSIGAGVWHEDLFHQYGWGYEALFGAPFSVLDVGALYGETALAFAAMGAYRVVAYEPVSISYEIMRRNVDENPRLGRAVQPIHGGVTDGESHTTRMEYAVNEYGLPDWNIRAGDKTVKEYVSFQNLTEAINMAAPIDVVKIDCEGCERELLPTLFDAIAGGAVNVPPGVIVAELHGRKGWGALLRAFQRYDKSASWKNRYLVYVLRKWERNPETGVETATLAFVRRREIDYALARKGALDRLPLGEQPFVFSVPRVELSKVISV